MFTARAHRFISYMYLNSEKILSTCICMYIAANSHKKSATPFWVAAGYVQAW